MLLEKLSNLPIPHAVNVLPGAKRAVPILTTWLRNRLYLHIFLCPPDDVPSTQLLAPDGEPFPLKAVDVTQERIRDALRQCHAGREGADAARAVSDETINRIMYANASGIYAVCEPKGMMWLAMRLLRKARLDLRITHEQNAELTRSKSVAHPPLADDALMYEI